jgi:Gly-Xaa carboxypeptidase
MPSSVEETQKHDTELLKPLADKFNLTFEAFGKKYTDVSVPSSGSLVLSDAFGNSLEPAPLTPTGQDAGPWKVLSGTIKSTFNAHRSITGTNNIIVSPSMMSGNTGTNL